MTVFVDTGVFYALLDKGDTNHLDAVSVMAHALEGKFGRVYTSDYVVLETTLLLRARLGSDSVKAFTRFLKKSGITTIVMDEPTYRKALGLLVRMPGRLSLCDATTVVLMEDLGIGALASFDLKSFSGLVPNIVGKGYFASLSEGERKRIRKLFVRQQQEKPVDRSLNKSTPSQPV